MDLITYAVLKKEIKNSNKEEIKRAVAEYLADNPESLKDTLGIIVKDGELCMEDE